jgi:hypothetical protein
MQYTDQTDKVLAKLGPEWTNADRVNLALALLHTCGTTAKQTAQAAVFFASSLDEVNEKDLWPLRHMSDS